jgi:hypothetical protein
LTPPRDVQHQRALAGKAVFARRVQVEIIGDGRRRGVHLEPFGDHLYRFGLLFWKNEWLFINARIIFLI